MLGQGRSAIAFLPLIRSIWELQRWTIPAPPPLSPSRTAAVHGTFSASRGACSGRGRQYANSPHSDMIDNRKLLYVILIHSLPDESQLSGHMEWLLIQTPHCWHWWHSRLSTRTPSVLPISFGSVITSYGFSNHCFADDTQLFLSFPSSDSPYCNTHHRMWWCLADISTWTTAHPLKIKLDKTELLLVVALTWTYWSLSGTLLYFHHQHQGFHHRKPWCGSGQSVLLQREHHCGGSTTSTGTSPSSRVKQLSSWSKCSSSHVKTTATCCWLDSLPLLTKPVQCIQNTAARLVQPTKILPCDPPFPSPPLVPCSSLHQIQDDGTGLQGSQWLCLHAGA